MSDRAEGTFVLLRYSLGGDRPSQTAHLTLSLARLHGSEVRIRPAQEWYFTVASITAGTATSSAPTYPTHEMTVANIRLQ